MNKKLVRRLAALLLSSSVVISSMGVFANTNVLDGNVTREEFAQMCEQNLTELGYNFEQSQANPFKDTNNESIIKLHNAGLLAGTALDEFSPQAAITIEQMAAIIVRMYDKLEVELPKVRDLEILDHQSISPWALNAVKLVYEAGLIGEDGLGLSPKSQIKHQQIDLVVAQSELVIADIKSKQVQDNQDYTYSPVSKTITIKKDLDLNELEMPKDFQKMIINAGVKITLTDLKIEEIAVNQGASVTLENMQISKLELLGDDTFLYVAADSQIEEIVITTEAKDSVLEIKNTKGINIKADNDFNLNGKNVDKDNISQHLKDMVDQQTKAENSGGSDNTGNNGSNTDDGNNGGSTEDDNNTDDGNNGDNTEDDNNTDDGNNGGNIEDDNNAGDGNIEDDNNAGDGNNGGNTGDDNNAGGGDDTENTTPDEEGTVQTVYDKLTDRFILGEKNASLDNVQHNLNLPWDLDGCDIRWEFSRPDVIDWDGTLQSLLGKVELTATISQGDERIEKKFNVHVRDFIDLEGMRQALDSEVFEEEISGDYKLPEKIGGYSVIYTTESTCVGSLADTPYILKPIENGTAELKVMMSNSGGEEIARTIQIKVILNKATPQNITTNTAISLGL